MGGEREDTKTTNKGQTIEEGGKYPEENSRQEGQKDGKEEEEGDWWGRVQGRKGGG